MARMAERAGGRLDRRAERLATDGREGQRHLYDDRADERLPATCDGDTNASTYPFPREIRQGG